MDIDLDASRLGHFPFGVNTIKKFRQRAGEESAVSPIVTMITQITQIQLMERKRERNDRTPITTKLNLNFSTLEGHENKIMMYLL